MRSLPDQPPALVEVDSDPVNRTLLGLTFVTGIVDAVCFIGLGGVFAAMQTGNVIFLGLGASGVGEAALLAPLLCLAAFLAGGALTTLVSPLLGSEPAAALRTAIGVEGALLAGAAVLAAIADPQPRDAAAYVLIAALSLAMGLRNAVTRRVGGPDLATTVLNLTPVGLSGAVGSLAPADALALRGQALVAILLGAVCGGLLLKTSAALALAAAAAVSLLVGWRELRAHRRG